MKITLLTTNLQEKLGLLNHAISSRNQLPILATFLLETETDRIKISSTDLEIGIETFITANVIEAGTLCLPAKTFTELVTSLPDESVTLQTSENGLEIITKRTRTVLQTQNSEEFPKLYEEKGEHIADLPAEEIKDVLQSVIFAASQDTARPALSGILMQKETDGFLLVATDGYRLSLKHYKTKTSGVGIQEDVTFLIPARVFRELASLKVGDKPIGLYISEGSNQVIFTQADTVLVGRLIEAAFPPYEKIIPTDFSVSVSFEREELQKAVKICSIFARDAANIIKLSLKNDHILVSAQSATVGENSVTVAANLNGEENEIAFNARYLQDVLANIEAKELTFEMTGPLNPGVFKIKGDESFLHLIMPIRVQG